MKQPIGTAVRRGPAWPPGPMAHPLPGGGRARLLDCLFRRSSQALRLAPSQAQRLRPCFEDCRLVKLGLDSLGALELRHTLHADLGLELNLEVLLGPATVRQLAMRMLQALAARELMHAPLALEERDAWTL